MARNSRTIDPIHLLAHYYVLFRCSCIKYPRVGKDSTLTRQTPQFCYISLINERVPVYLHNKLACTDYPSWFHFLIVHQVIKLRQRYFGFDHPEFQSYTLGYQKAISLTSFRKIFFLWGGGGGGGAKSISFDPFKTNIYQNGVIDHVFLI